MKCLFGFGWLVWLLLVGLVEWASDEVDGSKKSST